VKIVKRPKVFVKWSWSLPSPEWRNKLALVEGDLGISECLRFSENKVRHFVAVGTFVFPPL
jgi:hypothetical protein